MNAPSKVCDLDESAYIPNYLNEVGANARMQLGNVIACCEKKQMPLAHWCRGLTPLYQFLEALRHYECLEALRHYMS